MLLQLLRKTSWFTKHTVTIALGDAAILIAAGSVVLDEVPPCKTVAGIPARIVGEAGCEQPAVSMNHMLGPQD